MFEQESFLNQRPRDWSFGIYWAHGLLEECLPEPLRARLSTATVDPSRKPGPNDFVRIINGKTADELVRTPMSNVYRFKRSAFRALIAEGLDVQVGSPANFGARDEDAALTKNECISMAKSSMPSPTSPTIGEDPQS